MTRVLVVILALAACLPPAFARQKPKPGKGHGAAVAQGFAGSDRGIILGYYGRGNAGLPPGLAKRGGNLPPGLEKQLRRNGTLPPGLQKRLVPFPPDLDARLSPLPGDYRRGIIGRLAIVWNRRNSVILDVLSLD